MDAKPDPDLPCNGCTACAMRCTDGIRLSAREYTRILAQLHALAPGHWAILRQEKELPWTEEVRYRACLFLDVEHRRCVIYPARPLICRLFGRIRHLPCPTGKLPQDPTALRQLRTYTRRTLRTFAEWMAFDGLRDIDDLLAYLAAANTSTAPP